jgi:hypothetical protein
MRQIYHWKALFQDILDSHPVLEDLIVTNDIVPLSMEEDPHWHEVYREDSLGSSIDELCHRGRGASPEQESDAVKSIRKRLQDDSNLRLWSYIQMHDEYGQAFQDLDYTVMANGDGGDDQEKYIELMAVVKENRLRSPLARP